MRQLDGSGSGVIAEGSDDSGVEAIGEVCGSGCGLRAIEGFGEQDGLYDESFLLV